MSLMSPGWHYIRDGTGPEQIYDLSRDMGEQTNLIGSAEGKKEVGIFRRMLLDMLTEQPRLDRSGKRLPETLPATTEIAGEMRNAAARTHDGGGRIALSPRSIRTIAEGDTPRYSLHLDTSMGHTERRAAPDRRCDQRKERRLIPSSPGP